MKLTDVKTYKLEFFFFSILAVLSYAFLSGNDPGTGTGSMNDYFWVPSTVMQSIAAVYAVFIAIFASVPAEGPGQYPFGCKPVKATFENCVLYGCREHLS